MVCYAVVGRMRRARWLVLTTRQVMRRLSRHSRCRGIPQQRKFGADHEGSDSRTSALLPALGIKSTPSSVTNPTGEEYQYSFAVISLLVCITTTRRAKSIYHHPSNNGRRGNNHTAKAPTLPVETITVPYYPDGFDIQIGQPVDKFSENGSDVSSGNFSRWTEDNPPDPFAENVVRLYLQERDAIELEKACPKARAKYLKQYEANERALLEQGERPIGLPNEEIERLSRASIRLGFTTTSSFSIDQHKDLREFLEIERTR
jgi:hypothetical protein